MSSATTADALFWKAYGAAIQKAVGNVTVNDTTSFYLSTDSQRGPPGGDNVSADFTNEGIFNIGDNLLPPDQLFYSPSSENSYIRHLSTYMAWVDVGGNPTDPNVQSVTNALTSMQASDKGKGLAMQDALSDYKRQRTLESLDRRLLPSGTPPTPVQDYASKAAAYQKAYKIAYGALADQKLNDEAALNQAQSTLALNQGFNMECTLGSPPSAKEINDAVTSRTPLADPNSVLRPAYEAPSYVSVIKNAQALVGSTQPPTHTFTIHSNDGSSVSESSFNSTTGAANVGFTYSPWVSFSVDASHSDQQSSLNTSDFVSEVTVTVNYDNISLVPIQPSASWNLGDVASKYPNLLPGAPANVKPLVKPTMMVLATRLGYTVQVGAAGSQTFDSMSKSVTSGGGSVRIFGIPCDFGASASTTSETTTHRASWDSTSNTFTVKPTDNCGFATIVGMVGEKIQY